MLFGVVFSPHFNFKRWAIEVCRCWLEHFPVGAKTFYTFFCIIEMVDLSHKIVNFCFLLQFIAIY